MRPDLLPGITETFITKVFGEGFLEQARSIDLHMVCKEDIDERTPLLMVAKPGYDPSNKVDQLAADMKKSLGDSYHSFAMGSPEG